MAEEIIELAGEVIGGVAEAAVEIGAAAVGNGGPSGKRGCRRFLVWSFVILAIVGVVAYFCFNGA